MPDPEITPDVAAKVLKADDRNTIASVAAGTRLPETARGRFEKAALAGDVDPAAVLKDRQASLLKILASARRQLRPSELKELEGIIPNHILYAQRRCAPVSYAQPLSYYEAIYGTKERAMKRWKKIGCSFDPPAPPPLDSPELMAEWWETHMDSRVPDKILALKKKTAAAATSSTAAPAAAAADAEDESDPGKKSSTAGAPPPPAGDPPPPDPVSYTFDENIAELRRTLTESQKRLREAMEETEPDEAKISLLRRNVNGTFDLLRKCEKDMDASRKARGELIEIADVQSDWGMLLSSLAAMRERMAVDVLTKLAPLGLAADVVAAIRAAVHDVRVREDALLRTAQHWPHDERRAAAA